MSASPASASPKDAGPAGAPRFRLRSLPFSARAGLSLLLLVNLGGFLAGGLHLVEHHSNRDGQEGLSLADIQGAYHGVSRVAPLRTALEGGHPDEVAAGALSADRRAMLLTWLASERITEDYDNLDLDPPPADVLDEACLTCHSRNAEGAKKAEPFLDYWDDVKPLAFSSEVKPVSTAILLASTHTHAIALATIALVLALLLAFTTWSGRLTGLVTLVAGAGLAADIASMWLARDSAAFVWLLMAGGWMFNGGIAAACALILIDLWFGVPPSGGLLLQSQSPLKGGRRTRPPEGGTPN